MHICISRYQVLNTYGNSLKSNCCAVHLFYLYIFVFCLEQRVQTGLQSLFNIKCTFLCMLTCGWCHECHTDTVWWSALHSLCCRPHKGSRTSRTPLQHLDFYTVYPRYTPLPKFLKNNKKILQNIFCDNNHFLQMIYVCRYYCGWNEGPKFWRRRL